MPAEENTIVLSQIEPILPVSDIIKTVNYWQDVLGFTNKWTWGDPPDYGGISRQGVAVQFWLNPEMVKTQKGNSVFIKVKNLEELYHFHQTKNAEIVEPLENKPWGMAGYTLREINGHYLVFAGAPLNTRSKIKNEKAKVTIVERTPTKQEYLQLVEAVGWGKYTNPSLVDQMLAAPVFAAVAEDNKKKQAVGCVLLLSDGAYFFYVKDLAVHPKWQNQQVGSMLMKAVTDWLDMNAPKEAFVSLITVEQLSTFYQKFDFCPAFAMVRKKE